jgi:hypothetical protein
MIRIAGKDQPQPRDEPKFVKFSVSEGDQRFTELAIFSGVGSQGI